MSCAALRQHITVCVPLWLLFSSLGIVIEKMCGNTSNCSSAATEHVRLTSQADSPPVAWSPVANVCPDH